MKVPPPPILVAVLAACSDFDTHDDFATRQQVSTSSNANADEAPAGTPSEETPVEELNLPYTLNSVTLCGDTTCYVEDVRSNVSQEDLVERELSQAVQDFHRDEEARTASILASTTSALEKAGVLVGAGMGGQMMPLAIFLPELFFDFGRLRGTSDQIHQTIWSERAQQLTGPRNAAKELIMSLGGEYEGELTLANVVYANLPANQVEALTLRTDILGVEVNDIPVRESADGRERRRALVMNDDGLESWGWSGDSGSVAGGRIRFAVIEMTDITFGHRSFFDDGSAATRMISSWECNTVGCFPQPLSFTGSSHATQVSSVLLSDHADNQSGTTPNYEFAGIAPEATMVHYELIPGSGNAAVARAIDDAVSKNLDIVNISLVPGTSYCANSSLSGVMEAVRAAEDAGVLTVVSAGNDGSTAGCTVSSYGAYPDTLTVGGLADVTGLSSLASVATYANTGSNGAAETTGIAGGVIANQRMVDVVATAFVDNVAASSPNSSIVGTLIGNSFATPQVAGSAGLLKDWAASVGGDAAALRFYPHWLRTMIAVMADGATASGGSTSTTVDYRRGFGTLRFTLPAFLGADGYWKSHTASLTEHDVLEIPVGPTTGAELGTMQGFKFAALADVNTYGAAPALKVELIDKCPAGGGGSVSLFTAAKVTHKSRLRLQGFDMATKYHGRCLWVRVFVEESSGSFPFYAVQYNYSNSRLYHDM